MLVELTLAQYARELGSDSPAPGGGSASALAGVQAASLIAMYCALSKNPEKYGPALPVLRPAAEKANTLGLALLTAVDSDAASFKRVMEAFRLPKGTAEEKSRRREAIQAATLEAARVPLQAARDCLGLLELAGSIAGRGNPAAVTDLGVANLQAWAGLQGACYNVSINLSGIGDGQLKADLERQVSELLTGGKELFEKNRRTIESGM